MEEMSEKNSRLKNEKCMELTCCVMDAEENKKLLDWNICKFLQIIILEIFSRA